MKPVLNKASFHFSQKGNTDGTTGEYESVTIDYEVFDESEGGYFVIRTEGWSVDSIEEMEELFNRIRKIHNPKSNEVIHQNDMTQSQMMEEIQDLQDMFSETKASERYHAMEMLKNRISTFNTNEK